MVNVTIKFGVSGEGLVLVCNHRGGGGGRWGEGGGMFLCTYVHDIMCVHTCMRVHTCSFVGKLALRLINGLATESRGKISSYMKL